MGRYEVEASLKAQDFINQVLKVNKAWASVRKELKDVQSETVNFDAKTKETIKNITELDEKGQIISTTYKKVGKTWDVLTVSVRKATKATQAQLRAENALLNTKAAQLKRNKEATKADRLIGRPTQKSFASKQASRPEVARVQDVRTQLKDFVRNNNISATEVLKIWRNVERDKIHSLQGTKGKAQKILISLRNAHLDLGRDAAKAQEQVRLAAQKATEELKRQEKAATDARDKAFRRRREAADVDAQLGSQLGIGPGGATKARATRTEVAKVQNVRGQLNEFIQANDVSAKRVLGIWKDVSAGRINAEVGTNRKIQDLLLRLKKAHTALGTVAKRASERAAESARKHRKALQKQADAVAKNKAAVGKLLISWESLVRISAIQVLHQGISRLTATLREATTAAVDLQIAIAEVRTIANKIDNFIAWENVLRDISDSFGLDILDSAESAYQALSNQVINTAAEFREFGTVVARFSLAAVTSAENAIQILTGAINAFGKDVTEASDVAATFFKAIELGRFRAEDLTEIGNTAVLADQLNVSLEELLGLLTGITIQGVKFSEAQTQVRGILVKLLKPTKEMKGLFADLGVSSGEAAIATFGLVGFLEKLRERTQGSTTELAKFINRIRGLSGAAIATGDAFDTIKDNIKALKTPMEDFNRAVGLVQENTGKQLRIELNKIRNYFIIDMIEPVVKQLGGMTNGFSKVTTVVTHFARILRGLVIPAIAALTVALIKSAIAMKAAALAFLATPFGKVAAAVVGISAAFGILGSYVSATTKSLREIADLAIAVQQKAQEQSDRIFKGAIERIRQFADARASALLKAIAGERAAINQAKGEMINLLDDLEGRFKDLSKATSQAIKENLDSIEEQLSKVQGLLEANIKAAQELSFDQEKFNFAITLEQTDSRDQEALILERIKELKKNAEDALTTGDVPLFEERIKHINELVPLLRGLVDESRTQFQFEAALVKHQELRNKLIEYERDLRNELTKTLEDQEKAEKKKVENQEQLQDQLAELNRLREKFKLEGIFELGKEEDVTKTADDAVRNLEQLQEIRKKNGLEIKSIEEEIFNIRKAAELQINDIKEKAKQKEVDDEKASVVDSATVLEADRRKKQAIITETLQAMGQIEDAVQGLLKLQPYGIGKHGIDPSALKRIIEDAGGLDFFENLFKIEGKEGRNILGQPKGPRVEERLEVATQISTFQKLIKQALQTESVDDLNAALGALGEITGRMTTDTAGFTVAQIGVRDSFLALEQVLQTAISEGGFPGLIKQVDKLNQSLGFVGKDPGQSLQEAATKLKEAAAALQGGSPNMQHGGFVTGPGGIDNIAANLTRGEFVVNARSASRFAGVLQSINSSGRGGAVTGQAPVSIGDVNISIASTGNTPADVNAIGRELHRQVKRGQLSLT